MADRAFGILLHTSAVIAHLRARLDIHALTTREETLFLPLVAVGELYKGAEKSGRAGNNRKLVEDFLTKVAVLYPDLNTAACYAKIAVDLEKTGKMIPANDLWIAAAAIECDMPLATLIGHFDRVKGLTMIRW